MDKDPNQMVKTKSINGIPIYTQKNPDFRAKSDHIHALYSINKDGKLAMQCVPVEEVETHLASLKLFQYADAVAISEGSLDPKEYAKAKGYVQEEVKAVDKKVAENKQAEEVKKAA